MHTTQGSKLWILLRYAVCLSLSTLSPSFTPMKWPLRPPWPLSAVPSLAQPPLHKIANAPDCNIEPSSPGDGGLPGHWALAPVGCDLSRSAVVSGQPATIAKSHHTCMTVPTPQSRQQACLGKN